MKKSKYIYFSLVLTAVFSCKKDGTTKAVTSTGTSTSGYYAILAVATTQDLTGGILSSATNNANVYFSSAPVSYQDQDKGVKVDTIKLNGINAFVYLTPENSYYDTVGMSAGTTPIINYPPLIWYVIGNNGIPSFTYTDNGTPPSYTGYNLLPDTVSRTQALTINLTGQANTSFFLVSVDDNSGLTGHGSSQSFPIGTASVTFSASFMAQLNITNSAKISVLCIKNNVQNISGKSMNFTSSYGLTKIISIK